MKERTEYLNSTNYKELFDVKEAGPLPEKAIIFKSVRCEECGEECAEYFTRNQNGKGFAWIASANILGLLWNNPKFERRIDLC